MFVLLKIAEIPHSILLSLFLSSSLSLCFPFSSTRCHRFENVKNDFVRKYDAARTWLNDDVHPPVTSSVDTALNCSFIDFFNF